MNDYHEISTFIMANLIMEKVQEYLQEIVYISTKSGHNGQMSPGTEKHFSTRFSTQFKYTCNGWRISVL